MADDGSQHIRRKRLLYRSHHTGTHETDLVLGRFADARLDGFDSAALDQYEALLDHAEPDLWMWLTGRAEVPPDFDTPVFRLLKQFRYAP